MLYWCIFRCNMATLMLFPVVVLCCFVTMSTGNQCLLQDTIPNQLEARRPGEMESGNSEASDQAFDETILSTQNRPASLPTQSQVTEAFAKFKLQLDVGIIKTDVTLVSSINLYAKYYQRSLWYGGQKKCCPRTQSYGCRSIRRPLPCHYHRVLGKAEWCCPFYPSYPTLYIANCNCQQCSIFTPTCVRQGTCRRRNSYRFYYAICYRAGSWATIRRMRKLVPTSCYCR